MTTGETLCAKEHVITLERMEFPEPVIAVAIEPKSVADQDKLVKRWSSWLKKTHPFVWRLTKIPVKPSSQAWVNCILRSLLTALAEFSVAANIGKPQVSYRETIRDSVERS